MEKTAAFDSGHNRLSSNTGPRNLNVNEVSKESDGSPVVLPIEDLNRFRVFSII